MTAADLPPRPSDDDDALAAELALGVLNAAERRAAQARADDDSAFAARVRRWEERLAPLADPLAPVPAGPGTWAAIAAATAGTVERVSPSPRRTSASVRGWRPWALAASLAAAAALGAAGSAALRAQASPVVLAVVLAPSAKAYTVRGVVTLYPDRARVAAALSEVVDSGRVAELWLLKPGAAPVALGLAAEQAEPARRARLARAGDLVAVSLEPPGGAPGPTPTGPVVATGVLRAL